MKSNFFVTVNQLHDEQMKDRNKIIIKNQSDGHVNDLMVLRNLE